LRSLRYAFLLRSRTSPDSCPGAFAGVRLTLSQSVLECRHTANTHPGNLLSWCASTAPPRRLTQSTGRASAKPLSRPLLFGIEI
jgi:hypothetical protein